MKRALAIGINYRGTDSELVNCINDANDMANLFTDRKFKDVSSLIEQDATKANIISAIEGIIAASDHNDSVAISYSGHGTWVPDVDGDEFDGRDEAICPVDVFDGQLITDDELYELFEKRPKGCKLVFFSDSCHSGTISRFAPNPVPSQGQRARVRFLPPTRLVENGFVDVMALFRTVGPTTAMTSALLLSGCADPEYSYDGYNGRSNGAFTGALLDSYQELRHGKPTYRQLMASVREKLPSPEYPQSPQLYGVSSQKRWVAF